MITGALFYTTKQNPKAPDFEGTIEVDGKKFPVVGWYQKSKAGKDYVSLKENLTRNQKENIKNHGEYRADRIKSSEDVPF